MDEDNKDVGADRFCVAFRKFEPDLPRIEWVEVTVVARGRKEAAKRAQKFASSMPGLIYHGTN